MFASVELLDKVRQGEDHSKTRYSIEEVRRKIGWWNTWRLMKTWDPRAKGKSAFFEVKEIPREKYLDLISEVDRKVMNIQDFDPSIDFSMLWRTMRWEGMKTELRIKKHSWYLTIWGAVLSILLGVVITYLIFS